MQFTGKPTSKLTVRIPWFILWRSCPEVWEKKEKKHRAKRLPHTTRRHYNIQGQRRGVKLVQIISANEVSGALGSAYFSGRPATDKANDTGQRTKRHSPQIRLQRWGNAMECALFNTPSLIPSERKHPPVSAACTERRSPGCSFRRGG